MTHNNIDQLLFLRSYFLVYNYMQNFLVYTEFEKRLEANVDFECVYLQASYPTRNTLEIFITVRSEHGPNPTRKARSDLQLYYR